MVCRCDSWSQALELQKQLRDLHRGADWVVSIQKPCFEGDCWRVVVS